MAQETTSNAKSEKPKIWQKVYKWIQSRRKYWREGIVILLIVYVAVRWISLSALPAKTASLLAINSPTPTMTPLPTPLPPQGSIYLTFTVEEISQLESLSNETFEFVPVPARMVVVVKKTTSTQSGATITANQSEQFCVMVSAFLDENGLRLPKYEKKTAKKLIVILQVEDLARYGQALPDKVQIYLVPDPGCGN